VTFVARLLLAVSLALLVAAPGQAADGKRRDAPAKTGAASVKKRHPHAAVAKRPAAKPRTHRRAGAAYPSRRASRAVAAREAAARDAARAGSTADRPRAAPRERVESYRLDPPGAGRP